MSTLQQEMQEQERAKTPHEDARQDKEKEEHG